MEIDVSRLGPTTPAGRVGYSGPRTPRREGILAELGPGAPAATADLRDHQRHPTHITNHKIMFNLDTIGLKPIVEKRFIAHKVGLG